MRILVVGGGGREHALAWALARSPQVEHVYVAPGNAGTAALGTNVPIAVTDVAALVDFARARRIDLTVAGPEAPLVAGLVDACAAAGLKAFGPTAAAAQLEASKAFAKQFMIEEGIPTAPAATFRDHAAARAYLRQLDPAPASGGIVVKASGLAAGKGVFVCATLAEAEAALEAIMARREFGAAGDEVLIETCLQGEEVSLLAFCDGRTAVPMIPARDYKRIGDGDRGPNTGGMGGYAPSPHLPPRLVDEIAARVLQPALDGMRRRGAPYRGVLYAGLMLTAGGPRVLEFNCRFGDPETQSLLPLLDSDLVDLLLACVDGRLDQVRVRWKPGHAVCIVLAAPGYPGAYPTGAPITLDADLPALVFHAGTRLVDGRPVTAGGRVLAVTATAPTLAAARAQAYAAAARIHFDGLQYRTDIAAQPLGQVSIPADDSPAPVGQVSIPADDSPASVGQVSIPADDSPAPVGQVSIPAVRVDIGSAGMETRPTVEAGSGDPGPTPAKSAYAAAGVDIQAGARAVEMMRDAVASTRTPAVLRALGAFGGMFGLKEALVARDPVLVASTDGVGTKTLIAAALGRYDGIGHDIVNHCINDILVQGARPLFFLDYIAAERLDPAQVATVVGGIAAACRAAGCALLGGETAEMPGVYRTGAFDLAGTIVGWVERDAMPDPAAVQPGDVCLGLPSSGLHTNGYSLARQALAGLPWETVLPGLETSVGEALLAPHRAYLHAVEQLWQADIRPPALAHITGGGFPDNLPRALPPGLGVRLDRAAWPVPPIFRLIQARGGVAEDEMYHVFNMGIGLVLMLPPAEARRAQAVLSEAAPIGEVIPWDGAGPRICW